MSLHDTMMVIGDAREAGHAREAKSLLEVVRAEMIERGFWLADRPALEVS